MSDAARRDAHLLARFRVLVVGLAALFAVAELLAACGATIEPLGTLAGAHGFGEFFAMAMLGAFTVHLWCRPPRAEAAAAIVAAVACEAARVVLARRAGWDAAAIALHTGIGAGVASFAVQGWFAARSDGEARTARLVVLLACVLIVGFVVLSNPFIALTTSLHPRTFDGPVYAFDGSLGVQWSFVVGRLFHAWPALEEVATIFYLATPFGFAMVWAAGRQAPRPPAIDVMSVFLVASVAGFTLYHALPVVGPRYVIATWPASAPPPSELGLAPALAPTVARNCMPSMHTAWALLLWWSARGHGALLRALCGLFLGFTLLATLGLGYHYAIDLVVAVPFAAAAEAAVAPASRARRRLLVAASALVAAWFALLRTGLVVRHPHAALSWTLVAATVAATLWLERELWRASAAAVTPPPAVLDEAARRRRDVAMAWLGGGFALMLAFGSPAPALALPLAATLAAATAAAEPALALGGSLAALVATYGLVPAVGVRATRWVAVAAFLLVALAARRLWQRPPASPGARGAALASVVAALASALALVELPLATLVLGDTVYAQAAIAACLLGGFGAGALAARVDAAWSLLAAAACILGSSFAWLAVPDYFGSYERYLAARSFGAHEVIRLVAATLVLAPPMACLGAAAARLRPSSMRGRAIAAAAAVAGALAGATLGARVDWLHSLQLLAAVAAGAALAVAAAGAPARRRLVLVPLGAVALLAAASPRALDATRLGARTHVFFGPPVDEPPPPAIWVAGAAAAYNREAYARSGAAVERSVPIGRLAPLDFAYVLGTVHARFATVRVTVAGDALDIVGCDGDCPPPAAGVPPLLDSAAVERLVAAAARAVNANPDELVSTDDNRWLEYHTPRATVRPYRPSLRLNREWLRSFAAP